jgi:hypothetical protein
MVPSEAKTKETGVRNYKKQYTEDKNAVWKFVDV